MLNFVTDGARRTVPKLDRVPLTSTSDVVPYHFGVAMLCGWLRHEQDNIIAFLREENRVLKARLEGRRLRLDDREGRRLAELGQRLGIIRQRNGRVHSRTHASRKRTREPIRSSGSGQTNGVTHVAGINPTSGRDQQ